MISIKQYRRQVQSISFLLISLVVLFSIGCNPPSSTNNNSQLAVQTASLRLQWIPDAVFVGDYVALQKEYWKKAGLDVKIEPGGFEFNSVKMVAAGSNDFGVSNLPQLLE